jgi:hypothetical protein
MQAAPYSVSIVVDPEFDGDVAELVRTGPVWIVDTPANRAKVESVWKSRPSGSHLDGVTLFKSKPETSPALRLIWNFDTIDLHHGIYSADPPYTMIDVIGTPNTAEIEAELSQYGFDEFELISGGFRAVRSLPNERDLECD